MFYFSKQSKDFLKEVDPQLKKLAEEVLKITPIDFKIVEGKRTKERQKIRYDTGKSKTLRSKHCKGKAIDIVGIKEKYPSNNIYRDIYILIGLFIAKAKELNINIRTGALWNYNSTRDNNFIDAFHIELDD